MLGQVSSPRIKKMYSQILAQTTSGRRSVGTHPNTDGSVPEISELNSLAVQSLNLLFDEKERLFYQRIVLTEHGFRRERTSRRRTMIVLLGLQRLVESGATHGFDVAAIRDAVLEDTSWVASAGDLGLLTWFTAVCAPEQLSTVLKDFDLDGGLETYVDGRQGHTQGLAWFLAGIAHARQARARTNADLTDVAVAAYRLLLGNQSENGIFGHMAFPRSVREILSKRFGTFADQTFAVYALTTFAQAFEIEEPLEFALNCANTICALQGEMGQWWFLYDKRRGCVVKRYPVYSVNQDGTAPMALLALEKSSGLCFHMPIWKGLSWIAARNELRTDLRSPERALIWDRIELREWMTKYWEAALRFARILRTPQVGSLRIRYEARPDHFGWLLYALSNLENSMKFDAKTAVTG
jgi:hypothetical protein